ncbi:hypothetical protein [Orientia tsutsugamushi]|uniref:hypothetical protein n=1 Tax=Orientia tsutsugamushi TaxID=784 RepID=UPI000D5A5EAF|nr:IS630 family transposase [Orientia tsutsugamushi]SPR13941.1 IS630 family transposase [Orientia tsutsugamushi]
MLNPNVTLVQAGKHFKISIMVASYYMKKFSYSYKKTFTYMEAKPEIREKYQQVISSVPKKNLVYIDESSIEMFICKDRWWSKKGLMRAAQRG